MVHWPQVPAVKNVVEHVRAAAPSDFLRLHRPITGARKLPHQRVVPADVEIAPEQRGSIRRPQMLDDEFALADVLLTA